MRSGPPASLGRGPDSIEEGHYAERSWAGLLAAPLNGAQESELRATSTSTMLPAACELCPCHGQLLAACGVDACPTIAPRARGFGGNFMPDRRSGLQAQEER